MRYNLLHDYAQRAFEHRLHINFLELTHASPKLIGMHIENFLQSWVYDTETWLTWAERKALEQLIA